MRFHEIYEGIEVIDEQDKPIGVSKLAAKKVIIFKDIYIIRILTFRH